MTADLRLTPVIELAPYRFGPSVPERLPDEDFDVYWLRALALAGVTGVASRGGWLACVDDLVSTEALELALDAHLDRFRTACIPEHYEHGSTHDRLAVASPTEIEDLVRAFDGGYELRCDGRVVSSPSCCGDLADLVSWEDAAACTTEEPAMLWIGHPWQHVRSSGGALDLYTPSDGSAASVIARLDPAALVRAIRDAKHAIGRFAERLAPVVGARFGPEKARAIVRLAVGR